MNIASEITRLQGLRDRIRTKLLSIGLISDQTADLEGCADAIDVMSIGKEVAHGEINVSNVTSITIQRPSTNVNRCVYALICLLPYNSALPQALDIVAAWYLYDGNGSFTHDRRTYDGHGSTGGISSSSTEIIFSVSGQGRYFNGKYKYLTVWDKW